MVVLGIELHRPENRNQRFLLSPLYVLVQRRVHSLAFCLVPPQLLSLDDQPVINRKIGRHSVIVTRPTVWRNTQEMHPVFSRAQTNRTFFLSAICGCFGEQDVCHPIAYPRLIPRRLFGTSGFPLALHSPAEVLSAPPLESNTGRSNYADRAIIALGRSL